MFEARGSAWWWVVTAAALITAATTTASVQDGPQDGIQRNLLERQQREAGFHVKLYDNTPPQPTGGAIGLPLPLETSPPSVLDLSSPLPPNPTASQPAKSGISGDSERRQLDVSRQQRLQQLQLQNKTVEEPMRQQQMQIQQLQFDRENQARSLHDQIMRDSKSSMGQVR